MNKDERRFELVRYWWSKAEESLKQNMANSMTNCSKIGKKVIISLL